MYLNLVFKVVDDDDDDDEEENQFDLRGNIADFVKEMGNRENSNEIEAMVTKLCTEDRNNLE